jgi:hypothetical protein
MSHRLATNIFVSVVSEAILVLPDAPIVYQGVDSFKGAGSSTSRTGPKLFKNKGLRTIAASEIFSSPRAEKPVKFHRLVT